MTTDAATPARSRQRRGRRINCWVPEDVWIELEQLRSEFGTRSMPATITRTVRTMVTLTRESFDRREHQVRVDVDRRVTPGRRKYDGAGATVARDSPTVKSSAASPCGTKRLSSS